VGAQAEDQFQKMEITKHARETQLKQGKKAVADERGGPI